MLAIVDIVKGSLLASEIFCGSWTDHDCWEKSEFVKYYRANPIRPFDCRLEECKQGYKIRPHVLMDRSFLPKGHAVLPNENGYSDGLAYVPLRGWYGHQNSGYSAARESVERMFARLKIMDAVLCSRANLPTQLFYTVKAMNLVAKIIVLLDREECAKGKGDEEAWICEGGVQAGLKLPGDHHECFSNSKARKPVYSACDNYSATPFESEFRNRNRHLKGMIKILTESGLKEQAEEDGLLLKDGLSAKEFQDILMQMDRGLYTRDK